MTSWYSHESVLSEVFEWREKGNYCRVVSVGDRDAEGITEKGLFKTAFRFVWPSVVRGQCGNRNESKKWAERIVGQIHTTKFDHCLDYLIFVA